MEALRRDEIERARKTPPEVRALQALALMASGIRLKRASLRLRYPVATEEEIDRRLRAWLVRDE